MLGRASKILVLLVAAQLISGCCWCHRRSCRLNGHGDCGCTTCYGNGSVVMPGTGSVPMSPGNQPIQPIPSFTTSNPTMNGIGR